MCRAAHRFSALAFLLVIATLSCTGPLGIIVDIIPSELVLDIGEEAVLTLEVQTFGDAFIDNEPVWSSSSPNVDIVDLGPFRFEATVRGVSEGTASITVSVDWDSTNSLALSEDSGTETATATVTVLPPPVSVTIEGVVQDTMNGAGLADVYVQAVGDVVGGLPPVQTDALGQYSIPVTEVDNYSMCAIGAIPAAGIPQRFVNTNCEGEDVNVTSSSTGEVFNLNIETGYHLAVMGCPCDSTGGSDHAFTLMFDYRAWNRASVPATTTWIAVGIEGDFQDAALGANAGPYGTPTVDASGTVSVDLVAPTAVGTYRIFARLLPVATAGDAEAQYESGFPAALERNYIQIGTVTVN